MQLKNRKGEDLYILTITKSNDFSSPYISIDTWEKVTKSFDDLIQEVDDANWLVKQVKVSKSDEYHCWEATLLCNHKGWGSDFFKVVKIDTAYSL
jgi:hypothetical protein